ncbi:hypothetical protein JL720_732 [Aureococcus anophagefferens]|nr:hypothetical protein JL720_732 [Aureococcus anophagefferens]
MPSSRALVAAVVALLSYVDRSRMRRAHAGLPRYRTYGNPALPPVVLIPGLDGCASFYAGALPELTRERFVVVYELPLVSAANRDAYTFSYLARGLADALDELDIDAAPVVGESFGGVVAMHAALEHETRVTRLLLLSSLAKTELTTEVWLKKTFALPVVRVIGRAFPNVAQTIFAYVHASDVVEASEPEWVTNFFIKEASWAHHASVMARLSIVIPLDITARVVHLRQKTRLVYGADDTFTGATTDALLALLPDGQGLHGHGGPAGAAPVRVAVVRAERVAPAPAGSRRTCGASPGYDDFDAPAFADLSDGGGEEEAFEDDDEPPRVQAYEPPQDDEAADPNVRRSKRAKFPPMKFWKNERLIYRRRPSGAVRRRDPARREDAQAQGSPRGAKKGGYGAPGRGGDGGALTASEYGDGEGQQAGVWAEAQRVVAVPAIARFDNLLMSKLPATMAGGKRAEARMTLATQALSREQAVAGDVVIPGWMTGCLELPPKGVKDAESTGLASMLFFAGEGQDGALELAINRPEPDDEVGRFDAPSAQRFLLSPGDQFQIPPNNIYRLENRSQSRPAKLFCLINAIQLRTTARPRRRARLSRRVGGASVAEARRAAPGRRRAARRVAAVRDDDDAASESASRRLTSRSSKRPTLSSDAGRRRPRGGARSTARAAARSERHGRGLRGPATTTSTSDVGTHNGSVQEATS